MSEGQEEVIRTWPQFVKYLFLTLFSDTQALAKSKSPYINKKTTSIEVGKSVTLKIVNNKKTVKWSTSNKKIATVKNGKVTAKKAGKATIKAKIGKKTYTCKVTVKAKKTLVVYFSRTGTTKPLAKYAAEYLNADIFEIKAKVPYTDEDIKYYTDCKADREQNNPKARPAIKNKVKNMDQYGTIILGYPIWYGQAPRIISTFLESYDFAGKTIVPFCTSHSSGIGNSDKKLHELVSSKAKWKPGKRFEGGTTKKEIIKWLDKLGIKPSLKASPTRSDTL